MRKARCFISREKHVFLVSFSLAFLRFPQVQKNQLNTSLVVGTHRQHQSSIQRKIQLTSSRQAFLSMPSFLDKEKSVKYTFFVIEPCQSLVRVILQRFSVKTLFFGRLISVSSPPPSAGRGGGGLKYFLCCQKGGTCNFRICRGEWVKKKGSGFF